MLSFSMSTTSLDTHLPYALPQLFLLCFDPTVLVDPAQHFLMPDQGVLGF